MSGSASYPEAVKFLNALMEWVPDTEYLEIRTSRPLKNSCRN